MNREGVEQWFRSSTPCKKGHCHMMSADSVGEAMVGLLCQVYVAPGLPQLKTMYTLHSLSNVARVVCRTSLTGELVRLAVLLHSASVARDASRVPVEPTVSSKSWLIVAHKPLTNTLARPHSGTSCNQQLDWQCKQRPTDGYLPGDTPGHLSSTDILQI